MHPIFTIVITTHNRLPLLKRAVQSCLAQTVPVEVLVIDDYSSDGTAQYLKSMAGQIRYHSNTSNLGHSASINRGAELASGMWIKFLDDDDFLAPQCIEKMQALVHRYPQAVICSCQSIRVDKHDTVLSKTQAPVIEQNLYIKQEDIHFEMLHERLPFGTPVQVACCRTTFLEQGGMNSSLNYNFDDIDLWVRLTQRGDAIIMHEHLVYRMLWPGGLNAKVSIRDRLHANIATKRQIYDCVSDKYRSKLPKFQVIRQFLHIHWGFVSLKGGQIREAWALLRPALFSAAAWLHYFNFLQARKLRIPKILRPKHPQHRLDSRTPVAPATCVQFAASDPHQL